MSCNPKIIYQVTNIPLTVAGQPYRVAKVSGGSMNVLEITVQNQTATAITADLQFFEGLPQTEPLNGNPLSLILQVQQFQVWSKPGRIVDDDVYIVDTVGGTTLEVEVRTQAMQ
jgi:hypothetical protein